MTDLEDFFAGIPEPEDPLKRDLINMIWERHKATPRHMQKELGPSDVAHPCMRRMAFGMLDAPRCNPEFDPLPSIIGVATHTWLESAAMHANNVLGRNRWLAETRVSVAPGLAGNCDLYDSDNAVVIDFKVPGDTAFDKYRKDPGTVYRNQVLLYGLGFENDNLPVKRVAIAFLPRRKTLRSIHVWQGDYNRAAAEAILKRRDAVIALIDELQVEMNKERFEWIPKTPVDCIYCPWFNPQPRMPWECTGQYRVQAEKIPRYR